MDTSTFCDSTSTSAPVKLGLHLLTCAPPAFAFRFDMTVDCVALELLSRGFGRFRLHTSLRLRALIRSWQGVYVCKFRSTRTRFQFKKTLPGEHSPENFCCVGPHFQACMNLADVFCLRCFSEARKKHFRRNFRKCSRMRANVFSLDLNIGRVSASRMEAGRLFQRRGARKLRLCLLLWFLIFLELRGGLHSGNGAALEDSRGQLIPYGSLEPGHLGLCMLAGVL